MRAEEIIAEIYRQVLLLRSQGLTAKSVTLPMEYIRRLRIYKYLQGELQTENTGADYLGRHEIFNLEFLVDTTNEITVNPSDQGDF